MNNLPKGRNSFSKTIIKNVFRNLKTISGYNHGVFRQDQKGAIIAFPAYGDERSSYGWNIHHLDGDHKNNRPSNLVAVHFDTHKELHK